MLQAKLYNQNFFVLSSYNYIYFLAGVSLMGGPHPPLSQIPLPAPGSSSQDKNKPTLPPLGVPPPSGDPSALTGFGDPMLQLPFTLPPQLQLQGNVILSYYNYVPDCVFLFLILSVSICT